MSITCEQENRDYREKIAQLQSRDALTGLYNRKHFIRLASAEIGKQREGSVSALLYIRPDRFGSIDERFGPLASDAVLRLMGQVIREQAGKNSVPARFGGNIFAMLAVRRSFSEISSLAEGLLKTISGTVFTAGSHSIGMTASIGMVELSESVTDSDQAFSLAQAASREARQKGGDQLCVNQSLEVDENGRLRDAGWVRMIRSALEDDGFHLVYQPIASLLGEANNSYDVLVRMLDASGEDILPGEFMPAAERTGLMPAIDRWVIDQAFAVSAERAAEGKNAKLFLRVSKPSLHDPEFGEWLLERARYHSLEEDSVVLQVAEHLAEHNVSRIRALGNVCARAHFQLALANVGAGENSMQLIKLIPADFLVIDGSFMEDLDDPERRHRLEQIVSVAKDRQAATIATRVENAKALAALCHIGIDYIVGYHVQEPEEVIIEEVRLPA